MESDDNTKIEKVDRSLESLKKLDAQAKNLYTEIWIWHRHVLHYGTSTRSLSPELLSLRNEFFSSNKSSLYLIKQHILEKGLQSNARKLEIRGMDASTITSEIIIWIQDIMQYGFVGLLLHFGKNSDKYRILYELYNKCLPGIYSTFWQVDLNSKVDSILYFGTQTFAHYFMATLNFVKKQDLSLDKKKQLILNTFNRGGDGRWLMQIGVNAINTIEDKYIDQSTLEFNGNIPIMQDVNGEYFIDLKTNLSEEAENYRLPNLKECPAGKYIEEIITKILDAIPNEFWDQEL